MLHEKEKHIVFNIIAVAFVIFFILWYLSDSKENNKKSDNEWLSQHLNEFISKQKEYDNALKSISSSSVIDLINSKVNKYRIESNVEKNNTQKQKPKVKKFTLRGEKNKNNKFVSKGELICKKTLEAIYHKPFDNVRPSWLKNPETGRNLELDCYNEEIGIAVEYNGVQHYQFPNFTGQSRKQFINQVRRDKYKINKCKQLGIHLIIVPYTIKHRDIPTYIQKRLPH